MAAHDHDIDITSLIEEMRAVAGHTEVVTLARDKDRIRRHLQDKSETLNMRLQIMRLKYTRFQKIYGRISMSIIIISTCAAVIETVKGELRLTDRTVTAASLYHAMQLFPAMVSATTGLMAAIVKFCKYVERSEALGRTIERTVMCLSRVSRTQDTVSSKQTLDDLDSVQDTVTEALDEVSSVLTAISSVLKYTDVVNFLPIYHALTIEYLSEEQAFQQRTRAIVGDRDVHLMEGPTVRARHLEQAQHQTEPRARRCRRWCFC